MIINSSVQVATDLLERPVAADGQSARLLHCSLQTRLTSPEAECSRSSSAFQCSESSLSAIVLANRSGKDAPKSSQWMLL